LLFHEQDVGKFKAEVSKEKLREVNSEIKIDFFTKKVQDLSVNIFQKEFPEQTIILIDALDNFEARRWLNSIAITKSIPLVSGGMYGFFGNVQVIQSQLTPCLECQPLIPEKELQKACSPPGEFRKENGSLDDERKEDFFPALGSVSSVIGGLMSQEVLKLALEKETLREFLFVDLENVPQFLSVPLNKRDDCIVCSSKYRLKGIPFFIDNNDTYETILTRIAIQFNIAKQNISIIHDLKSIQEENFSVSFFFNSDVVPTVYITSIDLSAPIKLSFQRHS
jgi:molybdopterin/thiamine biosynthesis adenylyltransferase